MCLAVISQKSTTDKLKKSLPKWFPVWKIVGKNDTPQYQGKPFKRGKTFVAENIPENRRRILYKPGFHAFIDEKEAEKALREAKMYMWTPETTIIRMFWAKPEWITQSGKSDEEYAGARTVVLKKIYRK